MSAAVSATRLGCKVALINDRPVVGGNNSSEIRVHLGGNIKIGKYKEWEVYKNSARQEEEMPNLPKFMKTQRKWVVVGRGTIWPCLSTAVLLLWRKKVTGHFRHRRTHRDKEKR